MPPTRGPTARKPLPAVPTWHAAARAPAAWYAPRERAASSSAARQPGGDTGSPSRSERPALTDRARTMVTTATVSGRLAPEDPDGPEDDQLEDRPADEGDDRADVEDGAAG